MLNLQKIKRFFNPVYRPYKMPLHQRIPLCVQRFFERHVLRHYYLRIESLPPGDWRDRDDVLLHASFQIFCDYMEQEQSGIIDWDWEEQHRAAWGEMCELYKWWKVDRPRRRDPLDIVDLDDPAAYKAVLNASAEHDTFCYDEDTRMLKRLAAIREYLWT